MAYDTIKNQKKTGINLSLKTNFWKIHKRRGGGSQTGPSQPF